MCEKASHLNNKYQFELESFFSSKKGEKKEMKKKKIYNLACTEGPPLKRRKLGHPSSHSHFMQDFNEFQEKNTTEYCDVFAKDCGLQGNILSLQSA